jgi:hypothetical protein
VWQQHQVFPYTVQRKIALIGFRTSNYPVEQRAMSYWDENQSTNYDPPLEPPPGVQRIYSPPDYPPPPSSAYTYSPPHEHFPEPDDRFLSGYPNQTDTLPIPLPAEPQAFHQQLGSQYQFQYSQCTGRRKVIRRHSPLQPLIC